MDDHIPGVHPRRGGEEGGQAVGQGGVHHPFDPPLRDPRQLGAGDPQSVEGDRQGLAVEVAPRDHRLILREDQGVVGDGVELDLHLLPDVVDGVPDGPVDLGDAAQGIGVLDPVLLAVVQDLRAGQQQAHVRGHRHLALLAPHLVDPGVEGVPQAGEGLEVHRGHRIGQLGGADRVVEGQGADAGHGAGAVGHAQPLLAQQGVQGLDPCPLHGLPSGEQLPPIPGLSPAQQREGHMGQGGQVAGGPQRALLGHHRAHVLVEHPDHHLDQQGPHPRYSAAQGVGPQEEHPPDHLPGVGLAGGGAVA